MTRPRRNFDLPAVHLNDTDGSNYIPPKARDAEEIARRKKLRPGTLIREFQASGALVAQKIFDFPVSEPEDIQFIRERLAVPLLNSAWYTFAETTSSTDIFMRRELKLPVMANDKDEWRLSKEEMVGRVRLGLAEAANVAAMLPIQYNEHRELARIRREKKLGRIMGNTALALINLQHANAPLGMSELEIQDIVMLEASQLLEAAKTSHESTGVHASIAQLADPDSPLAVDWRRSAPRSGEARDALMEAQATFGRTA